MDANLNIIGRFNEFVNPLVPISSQATKVHNITTQKSGVQLKLPKINAANFSAWDEVGVDFYNFIDDVSQDANVTLVAHNGMRYDFRILAFEDQRHKIKHRVCASRIYCVDSIELFKVMFSDLKSYRLGSVYQAVFCDKIVGQHTADGDVQAMYDLFKCGNEGKKTLSKLLVEKRNLFDVVKKRCFYSI
jgi:DNA polymerase III alpha subunit (gram-positive type)